MTFPNYSPVQAEIVADRVLPALVGTGPVVWIVLRYERVDAGQRELLFRRGRDGLHDQLGVAVRRFVTVGAAGRRLRCGCLEFLLQMPKKNQVNSSTLPR